MGVNIFFLSFFILLVSIQMWARAGKLGNSSFAPEPVLVFAPVFDFTFGCPS